MKLPCFDRYARATRLPFFDQRRIAPAPDDFLVGRRVVAAAEAVFGFGAGVILSRNRQWLVAQARYAAMYVIRHGTRLKLVHIARFFGKDIGTVSHGLDKVSDWADTDRVFRGQLERLRAQFPPLPGGNSKVANGQLRNGKYSIRR